MAQRCTLTMMNFKRVMTLLFTSCFISVNRSTFTTTEVLPGAEATLQCTNFSIMISHLSWFYMANRPNVSQICTMFSPESHVTFFDTVQKEKFEMTSNISTIFLKIKKVDFSDTGLYFCGERLNGKLPTIFTATYLSVRDRKVQSIACLILAGAIVSLVLVVAGLLLKIWKFHKGHIKEEKLQQEENVDSIELNYATVSFDCHSKSSRQTTSDRDMHTNVIYAATR